MQQDSGRACNEVQKAHRMVVERGEKLSQLEERTEKMMNEAENFQSSAHSLMLKYKDKKWYQIWIGGMLMISGLISLCIDTMATSSNMSLIHVATLPLSQVVKMWTHYIRQKFYCVNIENEQKNWYFIIVHLLAELMRFCDIVVL